MNHYFAFWLCHSLNSNLIYNTIHMCVYGKYLPGIWASYTSVWAAATAFQRVTTIDDTFSGNRKMSQSIIFLFDACILKIQMIFVIYNSYFEIRIFFTYLYLALKPLCVDRLKRTRIKTWAFPMYKYYVARAYIFRIRSSVLCCVKAHTPVLSTKKTQKRKKKYSIESNGQQIKN